jgi:hypothetical protein
MSDSTKEQCSYWDRQEFRKADDTDFGFTSPMSEEDYTARNKEDVDDPACGHCMVCLQVKEEQESCTCPGCRKGEACWAEDHNMSTPYDRRLPSA